MPVNHAVRLSRAERRDTLLDAAAALLVERGPNGVTMEGIAARAGVTKALPYRHFHNAEAALVELVERFHAELGRRMVEAIDAADDELEARIVGAVSAYFDVVRANGHVLAQLATAPSIRQAAAERQDAEGFVVELFVDRFHVPRADAPFVGDMVLAILNGAVVAWARRRGSRRRLEATATAACHAVIRIAAD